MIVKRTGQVKLMGWKRVYCWDEPINWVVNLALMMELYSVIHLGQQKVGCWVVMMVTQMADSRGIQMAGCWVVMRVIQMACLRGTQMAACWVVKMVIQMALKMDSGWEYLLD